MSALQRIGVFCGSKPGVGTRYMELAQAFGTALARAGLGMVYGGSRIGLMGAVADAHLAAGGAVVGVIPGFLASREAIHEGLTELQVVDTMHTRKARMAELADAFVALPGGLGTLDELFEIVTWAQMGLHHKPIYLLNAAHYYDALVHLLESMVREGFADAQLLGGHLRVVRTLDDLMGALVPGAASSVQRAHG